MPAATRPNAFRKQTCPAMPRIVRGPAHSVSRVMLLSAVLLLADAREGVGDPPAVQNVPAVSLLTENAFSAALDQRLSVIWQAQQLRTGMRELSRSRRVAILIDRRLDPSTELDMELRSVTLRSVLDRIADELSLGVSQLNNALVLGPRPAMRRLRTDMELRAEELLDVSADTARIRQLQRRQSIAWPDLTSPEELIQEIGRQYDLQIESLEAVPHDLWAGGTLPSSSCAESLQFVLSQFDLTFEWTRDADGVRVVPQGDVSMLQRDFSLRRGLSRQDFEQFRSDHPGLDLKVAGRRVVVRGTFEEIEQVRGFLQPGRRTPESSTRQPTRVTFTFEVRNTALDEFMQRLEQQAGYRFEYDSGQLARAGVRLSQAVSLKMNEASPDELFRAMFEPLGLRHELDGRVVRLRLKDRTDTN